MEAVAAFTDTYLPTVNGVTYTITAWRDRWADRGGRMDVVYPRSAHDPGAGEVPVGSVPFPFYDGYRLAAPRVPAGVRDVDVVHVHTPFTLGLAGLRLARRRDLPVVASFHTPIDEYTDYIAPTDRTAAGLRRLGEWWQRRFLGRVDRVLVPSEATRTRLEGLGVGPPVSVLSNGVDTERFRPVDPGSFRDAHGLPADRPLVGYTGRHGYEKRLDALVDAAAGLDVTLVLGGDGPARAELERRAERAGIDARFLGFLERESLPAFYSALDVFAHPSPVETEGLVVLEAAACGTPAVGVDRGALAGTIDEGVTGHHFEAGDTEGFRDAIERALSERDRLGENCLSRRDALGLDRTLDRLASIYASL
ncbi:MAG: glycosyltransferase [Halobacteriales archaeon]